MYHLLYLEKKSPNLKGVDFVPGFIGMRGQGMSRNGMQLEDSTSSEFRQTWKKENDCWRQQN